MRTESAADMYYCLIWSYFIFYCYFFVVLKHSSYLCYFDNTVHLCWTTVNAIVSWFTYIDTECQHYLQISKTELNPSELELFL